MSAWNFVERLASRGLAASSDERWKIGAVARELLDDNVALRAVGRGEAAPDFALPNALGETVSLSELLRGSAVVLTFYRGHWCPYCSGQLELLQDHLSEFEVRGGRLVAISPQTPDNSLSTRETLGLGYEVLSDLGNEAARRYGIAFRVPEVFRTAYARLDVDLPNFNGDDSFELPVPATYVIGRDGTIAFAHIDADYTRRAEVPSILGALREVETEAAEAAS